MKTRAMAVRGMTERRTGGWARTGSWAARSRGIALLVVTVALAAGVSTGSAAAQDSQGTVAVTLRTAMGDIDLELYADRAPVTVANYLAYLDAGHYDGGSFYRVVRYDNDNGNPKIEVIQGGVNDQGQEAFPPIAHESTRDTGLLHVDGAISMGRGRGAVTTARSVFFICIGDQPGLDHGESRHPDMQGFSVFGQVVAGMDVVRAINRSETTADTDDEYTRGQTLEEPVRIVEAVRR